MSTENSWQDELRQRLRTVADIGKYLELPTELKQIILSMPQNNPLPLATTPFYLGLGIAAQEKFTFENNPIFKQIFPAAGELTQSPFETRDPLNEGGNRKVSKLIHEYPSRVVLRTTSDCPMFCRHCFRRNILHDELGFMSDAEILEAARYIGETPSVREVLVSGGDPLTASDAKIEMLLRSIATMSAIHQKEILFRICTRTIVTLPQRVTHELISIMQRYAGLRFIVHLNHPLELSAAAREAIRALIKAGICVATQTVLLRGINDRVETLVELLTQSARLGMQNYYLFQGDLAQGTRHLRTPLSRGLEIYARLRKELSGLELPRYAVDLGKNLTAAHKDAGVSGGKAYLPEDIVERKGNIWIIKSRNGFLYEYPEE